VRACLARYTDRAAGRLVVDSARPQIKVATFVLRPEYPWPPGPIDGDRWPIQIASRGGDGDRLAPLAGLVISHQYLIAPRRRFQCGKVAGRRAEIGPKPIVIRVVAKLDIRQPDRSIFIHNGSRI